MKYTLVFLCATAASATVFNVGDAPTCHVDVNGATIVHYMGKLHHSFKCSHQGSRCSCTLKHPTHHAGRCKQLVHTDGNIHSFGGDCTHAGKNPCERLSPCQNNGTCSNNDQDYKCTCPRGWEGKNCERSVNDCLNNNCSSNTERCEDGHNKFTCKCKPGWTGPTCATSINDCINHACQNGSTCQDGHMKYTCKCKAGFTGSRCQTNIDDCANNPCKNGGQCRDGVNTYSCSCAAGWSGPTCQTQLATSCADLTSSGTITVDGQTVYCYVGDNGHWALINAWDGRYRQTTGAYGSCTSSNAMNCKLSDTLINKLTQGQDKVYRFTGRSATNMYLATTRTYSDTTPDFNIGPQSAKGMVRGSYNAGAMYSACSFTHNWIDFLYIRCGGQGEGNNRWFFGHGSNDCYAEPNGYRCAKGGHGSGYGRYGRIPAVRMWVKMYPSNSGYGSSSCACSSLGAGRSGTIQCNGVTVYCTNTDNGYWALINAWSGRYRQTPGAYGSCTSRLSMNCKLADSVINRLRQPTTVYRFTGHAATNMYLKTTRAYSDTIHDFNIGPQSAKGMVRSSYSAGAMNSACSFTHNWIDFLYIRCGGQGEGNNRWFFGHGSNDCYAEPNGYRCAKGGHGSGYGRYGRIPDVRMYVKTA